MLMDNQHLSFSSGLEQNAAEEDHAQNNNKDGCCSRIFSFSWGTEAYNFSRSKKETANRNSTPGMPSFSVSSLQVNKKPAPAVQNTEQQPGKPLLLEAAPTNIVADPTTAVPPTTAETTPTNRCTSYSHGNICT